MRIEISYQDADLVLVGSYVKAERQWFNPMIGVGHPGCPSGFEIERVEQDGLDVTDHYEKAGLLEEFECMALEQIED